MGTVVLAAGKACTIGWGDVFRNVGCCEGIPAGDMGGIDAFEACASIELAPPWRPMLLEQLLGEPATFPCPVWPALEFICDDEAYCGLIAGWSGVEGTDGVRW